MVRRPSSGARGRRAFTLLESLFALVFLAILFLAVAHTSSRASDAFDEGSAQHELSSDAHRCIERIARDLELAERATLNPVPAPQLGTSTLTFRTPTGFAGGAVQWGPPTTIALELAPGELDDGLDNDGDELVDEGRVVWIENPGVAAERRIVLDSHVAALLEGETENALDDNGNGLIDEPGLVFELQQDVLIIRLTCERLDEGRRMLRKTVQTSVRLRN
jgi:type II secretory pathway pseudopilin PulG